MQLGIVGLGRMGGNIARRLMKHGHSVVVYDRNAEAVGTLAKENAQPAKSLDDLVAQLKAPRAVWVMLPAGEATESTVDRSRVAHAKGRHDHRWRQHLLQGRHSPR